MPFALLAALGGSLLLHAAVLFYPDVSLPASASPPLQAELVIPVPPAEEGKPLVQEKRRKSAPARPIKPASAQAEDPPPLGDGLAPAENAGAKPVPEALAETEGAAGAEPETVLHIPQPLLPGEGGIRYVVMRGESGFEVGRAEQRWTFGDGRYRLTAVTETSGLAALFKPLRIEMESEGRLVAGGLAPERFRTRRNGQETNENADFDWSRHEVLIQRDGSRRPLADGAQDMLSFHYQLAYLGELADGVTAGVATGKKFDTYHFESLGEEMLEIPAGVFRCLHLRVRNDATTEIWLAMDRNRLPVKIRHTDKKGDRFEQVAIQLDQ